MSEVDFVVVRPGRPAGVGEGRAARLADPVRRRRREARAGAAVEVVVVDADVVGRSVPGQRDVGADRVCDQARRRAWRSRVGHRRRGLVRGGTDVAGRVLGGHLVVVAADAEAAVAVAGAARLGDPVGRAGRKAGAGAAVEVVVVDADVVGGRAPAQVDRAAADRGGQASGSARRGGVGAHHGARLVTGRAEVAGAVLGDHLVVVAAGRGRIDVARPARLGDPVAGAGRKAGAGAAVKVVAHDADVVGRSAPAKRRLADRAACRKRPRCARRGGIADDCARLVADRADVAGAVLGGDLVVVGAGGQAAVAVARAARLSDPVAHAGREARRGRAVEVVAHDADVVGGSAPAEAGRAERAGCAERPWRTRGLAVGRGDRGRHVGGDLARAQGAVVDPQLVDQAAEVLAPDAVAADAERRARRRQ